MEFNSPDTSFVCRQSELIEIRRVENRGRGGRGVFAVCEIPAGTLIERVPVILIPAAQVFGGSSVAQRAARISWYVFEWEGITKRHYVALALGYASIYNHSSEPSACSIPIAPDVMEFHALRDIRAGEEILISYHSDKSRKLGLGFDVH